MKDLHACHTQRLMVNFEKDEHEQEREIEERTSEITQLFRHAEIIVKKFQTAGVDNATTSQVDLTIRHNMQQSMAKKLQSLSLKFRQSQKVSSLCRH